MPEKELPAHGGKGFTFCVLIVPALLIVKEKLCSPAYLPKMSHLRKSRGRFCVQMLHKKKRLRDGKTVPLYQTPTERYFGGVGPTKLEVCA